MKKIIYIILTIFLTADIFSNIMTDVDQGLTIDVNKNNKDESSDSLNKNKDKTSDETSDLSIGNKWYSRNNIYIFHNVDIGFSGTRDYLFEEFLFSFRFKSKTRHAFSFRVFHVGYAPGLFSNNLNFFNFSAFLGFEYMYKIFSGTEGIFVWTDFGACTGGYIGTTSNGEYVGDNGSAGHAGASGGYAFNIGLGLGSRVKNGFELDFTYLNNTAIFGRLDFYFLFFDFLTLRGKMGIDYKYSDFNLDFLTFLCGAYLGVSVKNIFRIEFGGGFTVNEFSFFRGFGSIDLAFNFL